MHTRGADARRAPRNATTDRLDDAPTPPRSQPPGHTDPTRPDDGTREDPPFDDRSGWCTPAYNELGWGD